MKLCVGLIFVFGVATLASARPDRNAFLNDRALTIGQIISQVKRDPAVRDRYRRHFSMNDAELLGFLASLRPAKLKKEGAFIVYSVPPDNRIKAHVEKFGVDTPIYTDAAGLPMMIAKCGNPLYLGLRNVAVSPVDAEIVDAMSPGKDLDAAPDASHDVMMAQTILMPENPYEPVSVTEAGSPVIIPAAGAIFSPWILGLLGGGALLLGGGDDDGGGTDLVPEPGSIALFLIGGTGLLARLRKRSA